ncbi:hypothetical protein AVEN_83922-1 [Araneus ventricosus]|uniref:Uncharacterized protein n=1 Tax=Araneus ventricosus TaxID=182803 RepID=A0A4Y2P767_ARAVE|nr:hypothetical protein AVEN_83922-1 [Araneus ventricosus]
MEDKQTNNDENSKNGDVSDAEECVLSLHKSLTELEENIGATEEDIWFEITDEMENYDKEDDDDIDPSQSLLTSQEALQSVQSLLAFFSSLSYTNEDHFRVLDSMRTLLVDLTV